MECRTNVLFFTLFTLSYKLREKIYQIDYEVIMALAPKRRFSMSDIMADNRTDLFNVCGDMYVMISFLPNSIKYSNLIICNLHYCTIYHMSFL